MEQPQTKSVQKYSQSYSVTNLFTAPESHLVSGGSDNRIIVWEAQNGKVSHAFHQCSSLLLKISSKICSSISSSSSQRSLRVILVQFVLWMQSMWRTRRSWWPPRHPTPQSDCGSAMKPKKVRDWKMRLISFSLLRCFGAVFCFFFICVPTGELVNIFSPDLTRLPQLITYIKYITYVLFLKCPEMLGVDLQMRQCLIKYVLICTFQNLNMNIEFRQDKKSCFDTFCLQCPVIKGICMRYLSLVYYLQQAVVETPSVGETMGVLVKEAKLCTAVNLAVSKMLFQPLQNSQPKAVIISDCCIQNIFTAVRQSFLWHDIFLNPKQHPAHNIETTVVCTNHFS